MKGENLTGLLQVAHLLMSNVESLAQLEVDLASPEMTMLRSRPTGDLNEGHMAQVDLEMQKTSGRKLSYKDLADKMLRAKQGRDPETELKELEDAPWPLDVRSIHHWTSKAVKNAKRDIPKHAFVALAEEFVVSEYRPKLLRESTAACFLRTSLHTILNYGLKKPKSRTRLQNQGPIKWTYPDGLGWEHQKLVSHVDSRKLLLDHSCMVDTKVGGKEIVGLLNRILKHKVALMKPGDPTYAGMVAPEVANGVRNLLNVSFEIFESSLTRAFLFTLFEYRH